jgi:glycosyltransferase involved in cell wall biosynthesis
VVNAAEVSAPGARRAVVLVGGPAAPYSRAIRIARALSAEGYAVEIAAVAAPGLPEREAVEPARPSTAGEPSPPPGGPGPIELRRYRPSGPWALLGASEGASGARAGRADDAPAPVAPPPSPVRRLARAVAGPILDLRRWLLWPHAVRGWWATLARELAPADLYHACGSLTIAAALDARRRHPTRSSGRPAAAIYDAVDLVAESNAVTAMPPPVRRRIARTEAGWAAAADAVVTINGAFAARLTERWRPTRPITVVPNIPEPTDPGLLAADPDRLRRAAGLGPETRIVLFHGRLGPDLGLETAAEAILGVPDAALVLLGFGRGMAASRARDADPRLAGRHVTLDARPSDEIVAWTAAADVCLIPLPPISANQRLTTPNKFWEAVAGGTPVVVVAGLTSMEELVREADLGVVAASPEPTDLAAAIRSVLDRLERDGPAWRSRIAAFAAARGGWPASATSYRALIRELTAAD